MLSDDEIRTKGHARIKAFLETRVEQAHMDAAQKRFEIPFSSLGLDVLDPLARPWDYDDFAYFLSHYITENEGAMPTNMLFDGIRILEGRREEQYVFIEGSIGRIVCVHLNAGLSKIRSGKNHLHPERSPGEFTDVEFEELSRESPEESLERIADEIDFKEEAMERESSVENLVDNYGEILPTLDAVIDFLEEDYRVIHTSEGEGQTHSIIDDIKDNPLLKALFDRIQAGGDYDKEVILDKLIAIRAEEQQWREIGISRISDEDLAELERKAERFTDIFPDHEALLIFMRGLQEVQRDARAADRAIISMIRQYRDDLQELVMDLQCIKDGREPPPRDRGDWTDRTRSDESPGLSP